MKPYLDLLARVRREGVRRPDRTGTGTLGLFGHQLRFDNLSHYHRDHGASREECVPVRRAAAGMRTFLAWAVPASKSDRGCLRGHARTRNEP